MLTFLDWMKNLIKWVNFLDPKFSSLTDWNKSTLLATRIWDSRLIGLIIALDFGWKLSFSLLNLTPIFDIENFLNEINSQAPVSPCMAIGPVLRHSSLLKHLMVFTRFLTDTGEDSKLVHRRKRQKRTQCHHAIFFFSDTSAWRVWLSAESKILASTFGRFRPVLVKIKA